MRISINGTLVDAATDARVSVLDHGFLFGDSIYEVVRTVNGHLFTAAAHYARFQNSARRLALTLPFDRVGFDAACHQVHEARGSEAGDSYLRVVVTRGVGPIDLHPDSCGPPAAIVIGAPLRDWGRDAYERGIDVAVVSIARNPRGALDPSIKSGNYLNNVLALIEARAAGAQEALMCNPEGFVSEGTTSNLYAVRDGEVHTPSLDSGLLPGITRRLVAKFCGEADRVFCEGRLRPDDFRAADECFLTSTTRGVMPITSLDGAPVGDGAVGPVTRALTAAYEQALAAAGRGEDVELPAEPPSDDPACAELPDAGTDPPGAGDASERGATGNRSTRPAPRRHS